MSESTEEAKDLSFTDYESILVKPVEIVRVDNTELNVEQTIKDVEQFKAGEVVESQNVTPIAHMTIDIAALSDKLAGMNYNSGDCSAELREAEWFGDEGEIEYKLAPQIAELLAPSELDQLKSMIATFLREVTFDRKKNHLGATHKFGETTITSTHIRLGHYERGADEVYTHVDPYSRPAVKYVMSLGVQGTGTIAGRIRSNNLDTKSYGEMVSADQLHDQGAYYLDPGTIGRFVQDRDAHYAPPGNGFRIFLETVVDINQQ